MTRRLLLLLGLLLCCAGSADAAGLLLRQSTGATVTAVAIDSSDHVSGKTGLTPTVYLIKAGVASAFDGTVAQVDATNAPGVYRIVLRTTDTDVLGELAVHISASGMDPTDAVIGTVLANLPGDLTSTAAGSVWDAPTASHTTSGSFGLNLGSSLASVDDIFAYAPTGSEGAGTYGLLSYDLLSMIGAGPRWTAASLALTPSGTSGSGSGDPPVASFTGSPTSGTHPLAVTFTNATTGGAYLYRWNFGDASYSNVTAPTHTYAAAGTYTVTLTATNAGGSNTQTRTNYVTVN